mgnify:CR=1 FL=1
MAQADLATMMDACADNALAAVLAMAADDGGPVAVRALQLRLLGDLLASHVAEHGPFSGPTPRTIAPSSEQTVSPAAAPAP